MSLLIIVLAITLIIGSMMWILPSPRERQQMHLRKAALACGIRVQLVKLEVKGLREPISCTAYGLPWTRGEKPKSLWKYYNKNADYGQTQSAWQSDIVATTQPSFESLNPVDLDYLESMLCELPSDWLAVEQRSDATVLYWLEKGEEEAVKRINKVLRALQGS